MTFDEYQAKAASFAVFESDYYPFASLMIEAAEFADLITKQQLRGDDKGVMPDDLMAEGGDVLWNLAVALGQYGVSLQDCADYNIDKLESRKARGVIKGDGGDR